MTPGSPLPALKKRSLPVFSAELYSQIPANELVVFSIHYLQGHSEDFTTEDIVSACFLLFPHTFALKRYSRWPDSALVSRRLSDCREKALVTGYIPVGFKLTWKGSRLAERVAKALGIQKKEEKKKTVKAPKKVKVVPPPQKPVKPTQQETKPAEKKKKIAPKKSLPAKKDEEKQKPVLPVKKEAQPVLPIEAKKKPVEAKPQKISTPVKEVSRQIKKAEKPAAPPEQMQLALPIQVEEKPAAPVKADKKKPPTPIVKVAAPPAPPIKDVKSKQASRSNTAEKETPPPPVQQVVVSKEEKARAGQFVRAIENSDAYRLFKKQGIKASITEFDFRSMLLCTMESSAQTLAKNVETFKKYASIQNRKDLILFLTFCEEYFASLLKPQAKEKELKLGKLKK